MAHLRYDAVDGPIVAVIAEPVKAWRRAGDAEERFKGGREKG
jgi:hypothetical protein